MTLPFHKGLKGGEKRMWKRLNRETIIRFYSVYGQDKTCEEFNMQPDDITRLIDHPDKEVEFTAADRAMLIALTAKQAANDLRGDVNQLRKDFSHFEETVSNQVARKLFKSLFESAIKLYEEDLANDKEKALAEKKDINKFR